MKTAFTFPIMFTATANKEFFALASNVIRGANSREDFNAMPNALHGSLIQGCLVVIGNVERPR